MGAIGTNNGKSPLQAVQDFASASAIKLIVPSDAAFDATARCFIIDPKTTPLAVVRPQSAADVAATVRFCVARSVPFVVRTGGHDSAGRSQVAGALTIDLRDMNAVAVAADRRSARVSGGALLGDVADALGAAGLVTPVGASSTVGYVGWATLAGYGLLARSRGLGVDQILAAKVVDGKGDVVDADEELLKGIRGAGPAFGIIVELTVKVYPLDRVLSGTIIYESSDFHATLNKWLEGYNALKDEGIPSSLGIQLLIVQIPDMGRVVLALVMWSGEDHEEGKSWCNKIAKLGMPIMQNVEPSKLRDFMRGNDATSPYGMYGQNNTISVRGFTPKVKAIVAEFTDKFPNAANGFCTHLIGGPSAAPSPHSVFGTRREHVVFEIFSAVPESDDARIAESVAWGKAFRSALTERAPEDVLDGAFVALLPPEDIDLRKVFGENYDFLIGLKKKYDPDSVFKNTLPKLI